MRRRNVFLRLARLAAPLALAWGTSGPAGAGEIVVLQSASVDAYKDALRGFEGSLHGHEVAKTYDMRGDAERGREILADIAKQPDKPDLVFAIGVWALEASLQEQTGVPIVYAMVLNPASVVGSRPVDVTGASMNVSVAENLRLLTQLGPKVRRVGVVYNEKTTGYLVREAKSLAAKQGLELLARPAQTAREAIQAVDALHREGIDAFWFLPDETLLSSAVSKHVFLASHRNGVPILGISERQAKMGAVAALAFASSEDIGSQAGELANAILGGRRASELPATTARQVSLTVNLKAARSIGLELPESLTLAANEVIQ